MKLIKSLLLGSAAGLLAVAGAQAADLPSKKAAPAEYVKVCTAYGAGFFYIPGTDTCIKFNGLVFGAFEGTNVKNAYGTSTYNTLASGKGVVFSGPTAVAKQNSAIGFYSRGRLGIDTRSETAYGTLRGFFRLQIQNSDVNFAGSNATAPVLDKGFVQWAGLTAGRAQSFFDFYADDFTWRDAAGSNNTVNTFAYTATFGGGFQATLGIEDARIRQGSSPIGYTTNPAGAAQGGTRYPNVIGALRVDQGWGSAQLSAAYTTIPMYMATPVNNRYLNSPNGYAVQGGVKINLPMLAAGDSLYLQAAYARDALSYLGYGSSNLTSNNNSFGQEGFVIPQNDVLTDGTNVSNSKGWTVGAAIRHYILPNLSAALVGSYTSVSYQKNLAVSLFPTVTQFIVGSHIAYQPVKNLDLSLEAFYVRTGVGTPVNGVSVVSTTPLATFKKNQNDFFYRVAVQRDF